jgi:hypothetical protein
MTPLEILLAIVTLGNPSRSTCTRAHPMRATTREQYVPDTVSDPMSASELTRDLSTGVIHWRELEGDRLVIDEGCDAKQEDPFDFPSAADLMDTPVEKFCPNCIHRMPDDDVEYQESA